MTIATLPKIDILSAARCHVTIGDHSQYVTDVLGAGDSNAKLRKNASHGFDTAGLSMLPHRLGGIGNVCPHASAGCIKACLNSTGMGSFDSVQLGRLARRMLWHNAREWMLARIDSQIDRLKRNAHKAGNRLAIRLNVFSDIPWERFGVIDNHSDVEFYDYTKNPNRVGALRPNYWVTFSRSESNHATCLDLLAQRKNVAAVWHNPGNRFVGRFAGLQIVPRSHDGFDVISGDDTDLRFLDPRGRSRGGKWVALKLKAAKTANRVAAIESGFSQEFIPCA